MYQLSFVSDGDHTFLSKDIIIHFSLVLENLNSINCLVLTILETLVIMGFKSLSMVFILLLSSDVFASPEERKLLDDLFLNYNSLARPVTNESDNVTLKV